MGIQGYRGFRVLGVLGLGGVLRVQLGFKFRASGSGQDFGAHAPTRLSKAHWHPTGKRATRKLTRTLWGSCWVSVFGGNDSQGF